MVRAKRVSDDLADKFKAHLIDPAQLSYATSGSEHSVDDDSDPCLSELVHGFLHDDDANDQGRSDSDSEIIDSFTYCSHDLETVAACNCRAHADSYRNLIYSHVCAAMDLFYGLSSQKSVYHRKIMSRLRELGHDAAICKTKWSSSSSGGVSSGKYEFIDVVHSSQTRYIIDLDFASQFEIVRPMGDYTRLLQSLQTVFVGRSEELKRIVKAMSDSARRSLKSRGLSVPPWRKNRYMQNKWLGPYRRTANPNAGMAAIAAVNAVKCRHVGFEFDDAVTGRLFVQTR